MKLADLDWRHHELGMLQAEFSTIKRIHLWNVRLRGNWSENPMRVVHDHRFDLFSLVVFGEITDVSYEVWPERCDCPNGATVSDEYIEATGPRTRTKLWEILNAKKQIAGKVMEGTRVVGNLGSVLVRETGRRNFIVGDKYFIPRRSFHTTIIEDFALTLVTRKSFDARPARILGDEADGAIKLDTDFEPTLKRAQAILDNDRITEMFVEGFASDHA